MSRSRPTVLRTLTATGEELVSCLVCGHEIALHPRCRRCDILLGERHEGGPGVGRLCRYCVADDVRRAARAERDAATFRMKWGIG